MAHDTSPAGERTSEPAAEARVRPFEVTNRSVLAIAVPMTLAYLSTPLLGLVDTAVIGQLGDAALLGGIALGGVLFDLVFTSFNFLRSGTTGLTAQAVGAEEHEEERAVLLRALLLAATIGLAVVALHLPLLGIGLWLMAAAPTCRRQQAPIFPFVPCPRRWRWPITRFSAGSSGADRQ